MSNTQAALGGRARRARAAIATSPLYLGYVEAALSNLSLSITTPLVIPLAVALGATEWQVGIATAIPLLVQNASQVPAARVSPRRPSSWLFIAASGLLGRVAWLVLAAALLTGRATFPLLVAVSALGSLSAGLQTPLWTAFLGAEVAEARRGSYFGNRNLLAGIAGLVGAFCAASASSAFGFQVGSGFALALSVVASSAGVGAICLALVRGRNDHRSLGSQSAGSENPGRWDTPSVRGYVVYGCLLILGAGMATPFYPVQFIAGLHGTPQAATTAIAVAGALVMLGQGLWGRVIDRHGFRLVGAISLAGIATIPLLWLVATEPFHGVAIWLLNGSLWAACSISIFSMLLWVSNESNRAEVVAWVNALQAPVNFGAPLLGGLVMSIAGAPTLFVLASASLVASFAVFLRISPPHGGHPR